MAERPLLCAWCGEPTPIVECIEIRKDGRRMTWHLDCLKHEDTPGGFFNAVDRVRERGPDRVGWLEREE